jgi:hypothetical protein
MACTGSFARSEPWTVRFGPVLGDDLVVGRVVSGRTAWLMTATDALVRVDLDGRQHARVQVQSLVPGEHVWGVATADGQALWTLVGRSTLMQVTGDGRAVQRIALGEAHAGVFSGRGELLYQVMNLTPPAPALLAGPPGNGSRRPWGSMQIRPMPLPRAQTAVLNLVSCGPGVVTIPCWFPDGNTVTLTDQSGTSQVTLDGITAVAPESLLAADRPRRPILDAFVSAAGELWVLGSGDATDADRPERRGGRLLALYSLDGQLLKRTQLPEPARMILGVTSESATLLAWNGLIVEARP